MHQIKEWTLVESILKKSPRLPPGTPPHHGGFARCSGRACSLGYSIFVIGCLLVLLAPLSRGQTFSDQMPNPPTANSVTGLPPYSTRDGVREVVNPATGSLSIRLPVLSLPQKGGRALNISMGYDNHSWGLYETDDAAIDYGPCNNIAPISQVGWKSTVPQPFLSTHVILPHLTASISYMGAYGTVVPPGSGGQCQGMTGIAQPFYALYCTTNFTFTDWSGTSHSFFNSRDCSSTGNNPAGAYSHTQLVEDSSDASYLRLDVTNPNDMTVKTKDGTVYHFSGLNPGEANATITGNGDQRISTQFYYSADFVSIVDPNGNTISNSGVAITDTVGRVISVPTSGTESLSWKDSNGTQQTVSSATSGAPSSVSLPAPTCTFNTQDTPQNVSPYPQEYPIFTGSSSFLNIGFTTQTITLPGTPSRIYTLEYDGLGELTKIIYPGGGYTRYDFDTPSNVLVTFNTGNISCNTKVHEITAKHVCRNSSGSCSSEDTTTYSPTNMFPGPIGAGSNVGINITDPLGNLTQINFVAGGYGVAPKESSRYQYQGSSTLLRTGITYYNCPQGSQPNNNYFNDTSLPCYVSTTLNDTNPVQLSNVATSYQTVLLCVMPPSSSSPQNACVTENSGAGHVQTTIDDPSEVDEFGFNSALVRKTTYTWYSSTDSSLYDPWVGHILDHSKTKTVTDPVTSNQNTSTYTYDTYGNISTVVRTGTSAPSLTTQYQHGSYGDLTQIIDPKNNKTSLAYATPWIDTACAQSATSSGRPSSLTNALNQVTYYKYDSCTGLLATAKDPNGSVTTYSYDSLGRSTEVLAPDGGYVKNTFADSPQQSVTTTELISATGLVQLVSEVLLDGLSRVSQKELISDPDGPTYTPIVYDPLERVFQTYNPTRCSTPTTNCGESSWGLTSTFYDGLGRTCLVVPPDGTLPSGNACPVASPSNDIFTTYSGSCTTTTDQAGKSRKACVDAFGRLIQVFEDPATLNYESDYTYDAFNDLLSVSQKGGSTNPSYWRARTLTYDSLSRLTQSTNPESGTISYSYDANGNLLQKTSPAPNQTGSVTVTLSYCYDALNRVTGKAYTAQTCSNGLLPTPLVSYFYDQSSYNGLTVTNGIGRRTGMSDQAGPGSLVFRLHGTRIDRQTYDRLCYAEQSVYLQSGWLPCYDIVSVQWDRYDCAGRCWTHDRFLERRCGSLRTWWKFVLLQQWRLGPAFHAYLPLQQQAATHAHQRCRYVFS